MIRLQEYSCANAQCDDCVDLTLVILLKLILHYSTARYDILCSSVRYAVMGNFRTLPQADITNNSY